MGIVWRECGEVVWGGVQELQGVTSRWELHMKDMQVWG